MGCDIHWFSETKKDGKWQCDQFGLLADVREGGEEGDLMYFDNFFDEERDYWLFGLLADVRASFPWNISAMGLPNDVSPEVREQADEWGVDGHSHSFLTRSALKNKLVELQLARAELLIAPRGQHDVQAADHLIKRLTNIISNLSSSVADEDQRIVFWFDS
jgi:hypothetical protein